MSESRLSLVAKHLEGDLSGPDAKVKYAVDAGAGIAVITLSNPPVNAFSHAQRRGLMAALKAATDDATIKSIVINGAGSAFSAGADISEFSTGDALKPPNLVDVVNAVEASKKPVVAAIHGMALGGGCELAVACHSRVAAAAAKIGLPEVRLGLIPGAGGTQRVPRLCKPQDAIKLVCTGIPLTGEKAKAAGLVDVVVPAKDGAAVLAAAAAHAATLAGKPPRVTSALPSKVSPMVVNMARGMITKQSKGMFAPSAALRAMEASKQPFAAGSAVERKEFEDCFKHPQSQALLHIFRAERKAARPKWCEGAKPTKVRRAAVIGGGTMGSGIAVSLAQAGIPTTLVEVNAAALDAGIARVRKVWEDKAAKGRMTAEKVAALSALVTPAASLDALAAIADLDLVIEAVFEDMELKLKVFAQLDKVTPPGCILATNTSTLDIDAIAAAVAPARRGKVVGMHFFSPANVMKLLENVRGKCSDAATIATAQDVGRRIGKTCVLVGSCPGFVANRMLFKYMQQAEYLLEEGASVAQVDAAVKAFGYPMGPFEMQDLAGLDVGVRVKQHWPKELRTHTATFRYCDLSDQLVALGRHGQKAGKGWYSYAGGARKGEEDPEVTKLIEAHAAKRGYSKKSFTDDEIVSRLVLALANEGFNCVADGTADRASDIDIVYVYGFGFPPFKGGPMMWAQQQGLPKVLAAIEALRAQHGPRDWTPSPLLAKCVAEKKSVFAIEN